MATEGRVGKRKWAFSSMHELHAAANSLLRQAILNERYKRWKKVISSYRELLWMISLDNLPDDYEPPSSYPMLLYELHFHLGVAYQHLGQHQKAVEHFTKTIQDVSVAKNGCQAGCLTNSCLMTPIHARRAFAHAKLGSYRQSLRDAEKAVVLDSKSPDVYCIRALVRSTFDDELLGIKDLKTALELNPEHVCATMLKASFTKPLFESDNKNQRLYEKLRQKAVRLCQEAETYLTCNSFVHSCILEFYDKFLFPLSVPHTITTINLTPEKPSLKQLEKSSVSTNDTLETNQGTKKDVFRCGTPKSGEINRINLKRRTDYGNAVRKYVSRPKSAAEFFKQLETKRRREVIIKRAESGILRPGERFAISARQQRGARNEENEKMSYAARRPCTAPPGCRIPSANKENQDREKFDGKLFNVPTCTAPSTPLLKDTELKRETTPGETKHKKFYFETPKNYSIPVFQAMNIKCAPRMYYRPWCGDKLPVMERQDYKFTPAFY